MVVCCCVSRGTCVHQTVMATSEPTVLHTLMYSAIYTVTPYQYLNVGLLCKIFSNVPLCKIFNNGAMIAYRIVRKINTLYQNTCLFFCHAVSPSPAPESPSPVPPATRPQQQQQQQSGVTNSPQPSRRHTASKPKRY